ncbi:MAG: hypothetical protein A6F72_08925 [Cycloclasticus sp. symbiont of Poecilosclerida sp. N]|nr:MAG: hypothetical protein A6F72_08925 [Cycloclasticus sp. symbiont of Poecilosclerida sp. N]
MSAQPLSQQISTPPTHTACGLIAATALLLSVFLFSTSAQADSHEDFVTTWVMPEGDDLVLTFPGEGTYTLDCGASDAASGAGGSPSTCTYLSAATYTVRASKGITRFHLNNEGDKQKLTEVTQWGAAVWTTMNGAFRGASALRTVDTTNPPDLTIVTGMYQMFSGASLFNSDISGWNVSKVTEMSDMFQGATAFNQDIGRWDVSKVNNMWSMFQSATQFNGDISDWDVSKVGDMSQMFDAATRFNRDIGNWDVSRVTGADDMFKAPSVFSQNLGRWYVKDSPASATPTLQAQSSRLKRTTIYELVNGAEGADNSAFDLTEAGVLSLKTDAPTKTYSLRISISGSGVFGTDNEVAIIVTSSDSDDGTRVYAIEVPLDGGATDTTDATDASLRTLAFRPADVTLDSAFDSDTFTYTTSVANSVGELAIIPTANNSGAIIKVGKRARLERLSTAVMPVG